MLDLNLARASCRFGLDVAMFFLIIPSRKSGRQLSRSIPLYLSKSQRYGSVLVSDALVSSTAGAVFWSGWSLLPEGGSSDSILHYEVEGKVDACWWFRG
jgi:hypothetical protein